MHDAIVAELMDRQEHIVDTSVQEGPETDPDELFNQWMNSEYAPFDDDSGDGGVGGLLRPPPEHRLGPRAPR